MKFSTRTTYGIRAMIKLAENWEKGCVSLGSIAEGENISQGYLERLFAKLKKAKLIKSEKGAGGGYNLSREPAKINLFDVVKTLEGDMALFHCFNDDGKIYCTNKCNCGATTVLSKVENAINSTLKSMKLSDLI